jgi:Protein of unknown function (DUF3592)
MFELFSAYNQALLLLAAAACLSLGGLLLAHELHWRLRAARVSGTVIGVRETKPNMFRTVYRYTLPAGQSFEATSSIGSSGTKGRDAGRSVQLLMFPDQPEQVSEASSALAGIIGAVFVLVGIWPLQAALASGRVPPITWFVLAIILAYVSRKLVGKIIPATQRQSPTQWKQARREKRRAELAAIPIRPIEEILSSPEARERRIKDRRSFRVIAPVAMIAGIAALAFSVHLAREESQRQSVGQRATGRVIALHEQSGTGNSTYYPVVRFQAGADTVDFKDRVGTNPPSRRVGEAVTVLYRMDSPRDTAVIDRGMWNWLPPVLLAAFAGVLLFAGMRFLKAAADDR